MCPKKVLVFLFLLIGCSGESGRAPERLGDFADGEGQLLSTRLKDFCEIQKTKAGHLLTSFYELKISTRLRPFAYYSCKSHENLLKEVYSEEFVNDHSIFGSRTLAIRDELQVTNMTNSSSPDCPGRERFLVFIDDLIRIKYYGNLPADLLRLERLAELLRSVEPLPNNLKFVFRYENSSVFYSKPLVIASKFVYNTNRIFFDLKASATLEFSLMIPLFDERHQANSENCVKAEDLPDSARNGLKIKKFNGSIEASKDEMKSYIDVQELESKDKIRKESLPQSAFELRSLCESRKINDRYLTNSYYRLDFLFRGNFLPAKLKFYEWPGEPEEWSNSRASYNPYNLTELRIRCKNFAEHFKNLRRKMYSESFMEKSSNLSDAIEKVASELELVKSKYLDVESIKNSRTEPPPKTSLRFTEEPFYFELLNYNRFKAYLDELASYVSRLESNYLLAEFDLDRILRLYSPLPDNLESAFRNETSSIFKAEPLVLFDKLGLDCEPIVKDLRDPLNGYFSLFIPMYDKEADFTNCVPPKRLPKFFAQN